MSELVDIREMGDKIGCMNKSAEKSISNSHVRVYKPTTLENRLINEVTQFIHEDRGVSEEASYIASAIYDKIMKSVKSRFTDEDFMKKDRFTADGNFIFSKYGIKINVIWNFYNVPDGYKITNDMLTSALANITRGEMKITLLSVNWSYNEASFRETIQHETMHFFENFKRGYVPYKDQNRYNKAYGYLKKGVNADKNKKRKLSKTEKNILKIRKYIAEILYISTEYEQRAFANGAYRYLMSYRRDSFTGFRSRMQGTKLFGWLKEVEQAIEFFNNYDGDPKLIDKELEEYGIDRIELMTIARGARKNILRQLGRVVSKAIDDADALNENEWHCAIYPETDEEIDEKRRRRDKRWIMLNEKYFLS